jgi:hypothetical protein
MKQLFTTKSHSFCARLLLLVDWRFTWLERQFKKTDDMLHLPLDNFSYYLSDTSVYRNC